MNNYWGLQGVGIQPIAMEINNCIQQIAGMAAALTRQAQWRHC